MTVEGQTSGTKGVSLPLVYAATLVLAACSLLYELLIAQTLSLLAGNTVIWYSLNSIMCWLKERNPYCLQSLRK